MSKSIWGPPCWFLMHSLATRVKNEKFETIKEELWKLINEICNNLPCPDCRNHAMVAMKNAKKGLILRSKQNLETFLFDFHNNVNKRKGYRVFTKEEYDKRYQTANLKNVVEVFVNSFNFSTKNSNLMMETFHRQRFIKQFIVWINVNKVNFE